MALTYFRTDIRGYVENDYASISICLIIIGCTTLMVQSNHMTADDGAKIFTGILGYLFGSKRAFSTQGRRTDGKK